ncbi:MAG: class I SAM-dependent methyltransferase [Candidatus Omnitrophica bacterium]|nr:class I SAM-dependent methyltransferase [Candidatus Omnitrophota bacterium]
MDTNEIDRRLAWEYDEFKQVGKNYGLREEVEAYDVTHAKFRDVEKENATILEAIGIGPNDAVTEIGTGTGTFAIAAAGLCSHVDAVDVSEAMLDFAKDKAKQAGATNIEFHHAGFLTYQAPDESIDAIVTSLALHHLPDFWKSVALERLHRMLKPGGKLFLVDVIIESDRPMEKIAASIESQDKAGGDFLREDMESHFREEFSTFDWVMDGLLTRSGFEIKSRSFRDGIFGIYLCVKKG